MTRFINILLSLLICLMIIGAVFNIWHQTPTDSNTSWAVEREKEGLICIVVENQGRMAMSCVPTEWTKP